MLAPWKKSYDQPKQQIKSRDITLPTKVHLVKAMIFPVVMYGCESWTIKKAEPKNWCFWTVMLESPLDCREIQPVHLKGNQSWNSLEGLMLKLKLWYLAIWCKELTHLKRPWCWKIEDGRKRGRQRMRWLNGITDSMDMSLAMGVGDGQGDLSCCSPWGHEELDKTERWNWTEQWVKN